MGRSKSLGSWKLFFRYVGGTVVKDPPANSGGTRNTGSTLDREDPLEKEIPTLVYLPGEPHGQRSLVVYRSMGSQRIGHN